MTLPANIRVNTSAPFPARVTGVGPITVNKSTGIWSIQIDFTKLATVPSVTPTQELLVFDPATGIYSIINAAYLVAITQNIYREIAGGTNISVLSTDSVLLITSASAPTNILLPASSSRNGAPVTVKDLIGNANTENITFVPNGTETIDGFNAADAAADGVALIDINYGKKTLYPLSSGGWYL